MDDAPPYTTLASTIRNLERKRLSGQQAGGNVYIYTPAVSEDDYKKTFFERGRKNYFANSYKELVNFFRGAKKIKS
jgi:predicted transcriptional regulator